MEHYHHRLAFANALGLGHTRVVVHGHYMAVERPFRDIINEASSKPSRAEDGHTTLAHLTVEPLCSRYCSRYKATYKSPSVRSGYLVIRSITLLLISQSSLSTKTID